MLLLWYVFDENEIIIHMGHIRQAVNLDLKGMSS